MRYWLSRVMKGLFEWVNLGLFLGAEYGEDIRTRRKIGAIRILSDKKISPPLPRHNIVCATHKVLRLGVTLCWARLDLPPKIVSKVKDIFLYLIIYNPQQNV